MSPHPPRHKRQPWYASLKQAPKRVIPSSQLTKGHTGHGQHRRTPTTPNRNPAGPSDPGDDGARPDFAHTKRTIRTGRTTWRTIHTGVDPSIINSAQFIADMQQAMMDVMIYGRSPLTDAIKELRDGPSSPYTGVTTGEIIGHRLWYVTDQSPLLCSLAHFHLWKPGKIEEGDTKKVVLATPTGNVFGGIYAFNDETYKLQAEIYQEMKLFIIRGHFGWLDRGLHGSARLTSLVLGTVSLWGDVVTHTHGYRASHAKVRSLDKVWGDADLPSLQRLYGTNADARSHR